MKKLAFLAVILIGCISLNAQEYYINLHQSGHVMYQNNVNEINNMYFQGSNPSSFNINTNSGINSFPVTAFDSITFVLQEPPQPGNAVTITYYDNTANIVNPYENDGVSITNNGANITVNSTKAGVNYIVGGSSSNGSLTIYSNSAYNLTLNALNLTSNSSVPINLATDNDVTLTLSGYSILTDNANSSAKAALCAAGNLTLDGSGTIEVTGNAKHGINVDGNMTNNGGHIAIVDTDSDGIHVNGDFIWNQGNLNINSVGSDGLDISGDVIIQRGTLFIHTNAEGARGIKVSGIFNIPIDGCELHVFNTGTDSKGIKCDSLMFINGSNLYIENSGDMSKGIKTDHDLTVTGGNIHITSSGTTVLENVDNQNVPAYCTAIKSDANILISNGSFHITLPQSNQGGKGISADGNITITGGYLSIETHGDGAIYTVSGSTQDTYSSACLRSDGNMEILGGELNLTSTGKAGKGIKVGKKNGNTYTGTYTQGSSDGTGPSLTISTTGAQVGSGGGGWPPGPGGGSSVRSSAKAIKVAGAATIYGGTTTVTTTKSGAEGLESKTLINIEGGQHYFKCYDDCIGSSGKIFFNGGVTVCFSNGNDAIDSNAGTAGAITIGNGVVFAYTTKGSPEEGFDCDNNSNIRITGTGIGISAGGSQGGGWPGPGGGGGNTISGAVQGYYFHTNSINFQAGKYYTLSNINGAGGSNMVTFSFETNCNSNLALITATGMVSGTTYYVKYGDQAPTNPTTAFHGLYLGGASSASIQAFSFTAQ